MKFEILSFMVNGEKDHLAIGGLFFKIKKI